MVDDRFIPHRLIGREAELQTISDILAQDGDFLLVGAPGIGRRTLIRAAANHIKARVLEIDCLRTTSAVRFLQLLAEELMGVFVDPIELALIERWSVEQPLVLEKQVAQRPRLVWQLSKHQDAHHQEWTLFKALLALPQRMAEWLDCRVVIVFLNFPHIRSWDRTGEWEAYLQREIQQQSRVSYALVSTIAESWVQQGNIQIVSLAPLKDSSVENWVVDSMAAEGLQFDQASQALSLFIRYVNGHLGDAIALARRIWLDWRAWRAEPPQPSSKLKGESMVDQEYGLIEAHHVHRSMLAIVEDLSITFEALILLLPPSQVRVLESLALDPTDKPHAREYIQKHQLSRGGGLQGALTSLEQKGLVYGPQYGYQVALPFLAFWLKQRLN